MQGFPIQILSPYMVDGDLDRNREGLTLQEWGIETSTFATKITDKATRDESRWVKVKQERLSCFPKKMGV